MPRTARIVAVEYPHHITQRGNNRQDVFFTDDDRRRYLDILKAESEKHRLLILGYCLMTNHVHIIAKPKEPQSLAKAIGRTHFRYTQYINRYHGRNGHLWQNRFYSCALDGGHYWTAMKYIERNPVRAKMIRRAWKYEWSSAAAHSGKGAPASLLEMEIWNNETSPERWQKILVEKEDAGAVEQLRSKTSTGRPLGSDSFISKLEARFGRRLRPLPPGRPRKANK